MIALSRGTHKRARHIPPFIVDNFRAPRYHADMRIKGFEPFCPEGSALLVLGSFPSVRSRETEFYYGHPQNRFWRTVTEYFSLPLPVTIEEKKAMLASHGIALWDVVTECEISGSSDAAIRDPVTAKVGALMHERGITLALVNGKKAFSLLLKAEPELAPSVRLMPSTSPANPHFDKRVWFAAFDEIFAPRPVTGSDGAPLVGHADNEK